MKMNINKSLEIRIESFESRFLVSVVDEEGKVLWFSSLEDGQDIKSLLSMAREAAKQISAERP